LTEEQKDTFRRSSYGPVDDFDREILNFDWNDDSSRLAFVVSYASARLQGQSLPGPAAEVTVARCDRSRSGTWSCTERDLIDAGKEFGVDLTQYRQQWVDPAPLLRRMLEKP
jgi:hypothetical protein